MEKIVKDMSVGQVNILENANWVKTYGEKCRTFYSMFLPTMFMSLPSVFTMYDTIRKLDFHAIPVINGVAINLAIQPAVFCRGQKEEEKPRESFKRVKVGAGAMIIISGR